MSAPSTLERRLHQQEVVADLGQQALETDDLDQLMHDASVAVSETLENEYCKVLELLPGGDAVLLRQGVGWRDGLVGSATVPTDLDSQAGYTLITEEPVIVDDLRTEDRFSGPELLTSHDVISGISVIIGSVEEPWGVLGTHTTERRNFTEHDATFVQSVANVLGSAIERKQRKQALEWSNQRTELALSATDATIWEWDFEADRVTTNPDPHGLFQTAIRTGDELLEVIHPEDRKRVEQALYEASETETPYEVEYRYHVGESVRWAEDYGELFDPIKRNRPRMLGVTNDITERKERELDLEKHHALTEAANDVIITINEDSVIQTVNPVIEEVFGYEPAELTGESLTVLMPDELAPRHRQAVERYLRTGERALDWDYIELPGRRRDGSEIEVAVSFSEVEFAGGRYFTGVIRDITERKDRERALEESHERLEEFASAVSHDLREPLSTVASYLQMLERRYEDELDEDAQEFIDFAVDGATRMQEMIDGLVTTYARVGSEGDALEPVDLEDIVEDVLVDLEPKIGATDADITTEPLPTVAGARGQLRQLFMNLVDNAIKYSGDEPPAVHITAEESEDMHQIEVRDEGIGLEPDVQDQVFEVFWRLHPEDESPGTGIGLALCERIVDRHGGDIWINATPGEGSTFYFTLPAAT